MADKVQLIKEEIESYKESMKGLEPHSDFRRGQITAYNQIIQFIDSLPEEPSVKGITWEDVNTLESLIYQVHNEYPSIGEKSFGLEVLERFQDCQDDIEEPASEDLEEAALKYRWEHPFCDGYTAYSFKAGAEWQKQQMMKNAVHAWVNTYESVTNPYDNQVSFITNLSPSKFRNKETAQIIIVKTK